MDVTGAVLNTLGVGFRRSFADGLREAGQGLSGPIVTMVPSNTTTNEYAWLGRFPNMREWIGDRVIEQLEGESYSIRNRLWEDTVSVRRTDIEDDNVGIYTPLMAGLGRAVGVFWDQLVFDLFEAGFSTACYDGQNFFDTDHPLINRDTGAASVVSNMQAGASDPWYLLDLRQSLRPFILQKRAEPEFVSKDDPRTSDSVFMRDEFLYGARARGNAGYGFWQMAYASKAELSAANFEAAFLAMETQKNEWGRPLGIRATHLYCGPSNRNKAEAILKQRTLANGSSNPHEGRVELVVVPWLV